MTWTIFGLCILAAGIIGGVVGYVIRRHAERNKQIDGVLIITSDADGVYLSTMLYENPETFIKRDYVKFKVSHK